MSELVPAAGQPSQRTTRSSDEIEDAAAEEEPVADRLATTVMVLLGVMVVLSAFLAFATFNRFLALDASLDYSSSGHVTEAAERALADEGDLLAAAMRLFLLGLLATAPLFIIWQHRHARVANSLAPEEGVARPAWAIVGWFVPIFNLWLPGMQLYRSSRASDPDVPLGGPSGHVVGNKRVKPWAIAMGAAVGIELLASSYEPGPSSPMSEQEAIDSYVQAESIHSIAPLCLAVAAIIGIVMVRELQRAQDVKLMRDVSHQPDLPSQPASA